MAWVESGEFEGSYTQATHATQPAPATHSTPTDPLWQGDSGTLRAASRRALSQLVRGPYLSAERHPDLWRALINDTEAIRSRLADLYLTLALDFDSEIAFIQTAKPDAGPAPQLVRTMPLTFIQTVLLLSLRTELVRAGRGERVIVGRDEITAGLQIYRSTLSLDEAGFAKRVSAAWTKLKDLNILLPTSTEERFEVSPVLRLILGPEEVELISAEYARLGAQLSTSDDGDGDAPPVDEAAMPKNSAVPLKTASPRNSSSTPAPVASPQSLPEPTPRKDKANPKKATHNQPDFGLFDTLDVNPDGSEETNE